MDWNKLTYGETCLLIERLRQALPAATRAQIAERMNITRSKAAKLLLRVRHPYASEDFGGTVTYSKSFSPEYMNENRFIWTGDNVPLHVGAENQLRHQVAPRLEGITNELQILALTTPSAEIKTILLELIEDLGYARSKVVRVAEKYAQSNTK